MPTPHAAAVEAAREVLTPFIGKYDDGTFGQAAEIITRRYAPLVEAAELVLARHDAGKIVNKSARTLRSALAEVTKGEKL